MAEEQQMPMLKVSILHYRNLSKGEDEWIHWYQNEQIPRFIPVAQRRGIDRCELYITPTKYKEPFQIDLDNLKNKKLRDMLNDPEWNDKVATFEKGWIDQTKVDVQVGHQYTYIEGNNIVNTVTKEYPN
ncbi:hypothetical protein F4780DRAFT_780675 [Xylariomycetidae sp. FL0641]|nr:hypothetical protein F4780DRAFT_780675 [Xylariomycetidae sp. FL0641]